MRLNNATSILEIIKTTYPISLYVSIYVYIYMLMKNKYNYSGPLVFKIQRQRVWYQRHQKLLPHYQHVKNQLIS